MDQWTGNRGSEDYTHVSIDSHIHDRHTIYSKFCYNRSNSTREVVGCKRKSEGKERKRKMKGKQKAKTYVTCMTIFLTLYSTVELKFDGQFTGGFRGTGTGSKAVELKFGWHSRKLNRLICQNSTRLIQ